jgi:hypothetical protein
MAESPEDRPNTHKNDPDPGAERSPEQEKREPARERNPGQKSPSPGSRDRDENADNPDRDIAEEDNK